MTKQTKRKGKTKMKNYQVNDVVQFMGDEYKVVEVLQMEDAVHIKKTSAPGNSMVVPILKLQANFFVGESETEDYELAAAGILSQPKDSPTQEEADAEIAQVLEDLEKKFDPLEGYDEVDVPDFDVAKENQPDLLYRPDDRINL